MTIPKTLFCCICCLSLIVLASGCRQEKKLDVNDGAEAQQAEMEAWFAECDAKAAALPRVPVETAEDGVLILADANFMETVNEGGILVVDFWMDNCFACEEMEPVVQQLARLYAGTIRFAKLHFNSNEIMTEKYRVRGFPTFAIFVDGKLVGLLPGMQPTERFRMILDRVLLDYQAKQEEEASSGNETY